MQSRRISYKIGGGEYLVCLICLDLGKGVMHASKVMAVVMALGGFLWAEGMAQEVAPARLVGTVREGRWCWNPYQVTNAMVADAQGGFSAVLKLAPDGGRNRDGIYAMRFYSGPDLSSVFKRGEKSGKLVSGAEARRGGNIIFRVKSAGEYRVRFDPQAGSYLIYPAVEELMQIESMQMNGFVHDKEGSVECFDGRRTRPAEKWDEWMPTHEMKRGKDGTWSIQLPLSAQGGHEKNGVYQSLFSANHNGDWGYGGVIGKPDQLSGGNGYDSRVGRIGESAIVFRVVRDGTYTITVHPTKYTMQISPKVEFFTSARYQVDGDVVPDPWNPEAPSHDMEQMADGRWQKLLALKKDGGSGGSGLYTMNFSIDSNWALDSIGFGGVWGRAWHSDPQEWNLLFRVPADGVYKVILDPENDRFEIDPPVLPVTGVDTLQIAGDFEELGQDGAGGWNPQAAGHEMRTDDGNVYWRDLKLTKGKNYSYKFTANRAGWSWSLVDYPYDGYRRLAPHGNPPPLRFDCPRNGVYRFTADLRTGDYRVELIELSAP